MDAIYKLTGFDYGKHVKTFYLSDPVEVRNLAKRLEGAFVTCHNPDALRASIEALCLSATKAAKAGKGRLALRRGEQITELLEVFSSFRSSPEGQRVWTTYRAMLPANGMFWEVTCGPEGECYAHGGQEEIRVRVPATKGETFSILDLEKALGIREGEDLFFVPIGYEVD